VPPIIVTMLDVMVAEEVVELPLLVLSVVTGFAECAVELVGSVGDFVGTLKAELGVDCAVGIIGAVPEALLKVGAVVSVPSNVVERFWLDREICGEELLLLLLVGPEMRSPLTLMLGSKVGMLKVVVAIIWIEEIPVIELVLGFHCSSACSNDRERLTRIPCHVHTPLTCTPPKPRFLPH
jgi:hypothetical protein